MANRGKEILALCLGVAALATAIHTFRYDPGDRYTSPRHSARTEASRLRQARATSDQSKPKAPPRDLVLAEARQGVLDRNPFSRPVGAPSAAPPPEPEPATSAQPATGAAPAPTALASAPAPPTTALLPPLAGQTPPLGTTVMTPPVPSSPSLAGVVGDRFGQQTAVIRVGNRRYFAKQGDKVAGKYLVQSVSDGQVVLDGAEGKLILKMGGSE